jgi:hypothetical protein
MVDTCYVASMRRCFFEEFGHEWPVLLLPTWTAGKNKGAARPFWKDQGVAVISVGSG